MPADNLNLNPESHDSMQQPIHASLPSPPSPTAHRVDWQVVFFLSLNTLPMDMETAAASINPDISNLACLLSESASVQCRVLSVNMMLIEDLQSSMETHLPDLLVLYADSQDTSAHRAETIAHWCETLRDAQPRPIIVVLGGENEQERMTWLMCGADDVLPLSLSLDELRVRLLIQLRRNLESNAHPVTQLPGLLAASKILQRRMNRYRTQNGNQMEQSELWALLVIGLDYFEPYQEQYGYLAANQALRSFVAMLLRSVVLPDFIAQTDMQDFVVLTHPEKAAKIASLLCRQFEAAVPNFYSDHDRKQGYLISAPDESAWRKIPLMSLSIGIVTAKTHSQPSCLSAYHTALSMRQVARLTPGNAWVMDKLQLAGSQVTISRSDFPVLVVESDAALAFLLKTTLQMDGYQVETVSCAEEATRYLGLEEENSATDASAGSNFSKAAQPEQEPLAPSPGQSTPPLVRLVVLDALLSGDNVFDDHQTPLSGLTLIRAIKAQCPQISVLCTSSLHQRERVLQAGADLYLPKPYEIRSLFAWIERLLLV